MRQAKTTVMSRQMAIRYCHQPHETNSVMISISDPYLEYESSPFTGTRSGVRAILRLSFCDADKVGGLSAFGRRVTVKDLISEDDAKTIAKFVRRHAEEDIIVHCDAGISRSAGVGAAIEKWRNNDDSLYFDSGRYRPNMLVYRKVLEALYDMQEGGKNG